MSTSSSAARVGAAAFVLGVALAGPLAGTVPVAAADSPDTSVADAPDTAAAKPARTARGPKAAARGGVARSASPRPAAAGAPQVSDTPAGNKARPRGGSRTPAPAGTGPSAALASPESSMSAPVAADSPAAQPPAMSTVSAGSTAARNGTGPVEPAAQSVLQAGGPAPVTAPVAPAATVAAPTALAMVSTPTGAATSPFAGVLGGLFGPIRSYFEGAALMVRRRFFNEAPTVNPVQLTGLITGPITGTIGATDPEGDPLTYAVTGDPRNGTVTVGQDGSYTYTPGANFAGSDSFVVAVTDTGRHINLRDLKRPSSTYASVAVAQGESAPMLRFQFVYGAGSQYWSSEARSALENAAAQLAAYFVVSSPVTITYEVTGQRSALSATLASAGSEFVDTGAGFKQTVVQNKIQTGVDSNGSTADGGINWNFGPSWGFGNTVSNGQYDFQSTAMHELLHTLGFLSYVDRPGNNSGQSWTVYDSYLVTFTGTPVIGGNYRWNTAYNTNLTGGDGGLFFGGPNAVAAYGGPVPLYTPFPFSSGSSVSHLDDNSFTGADEQLMNAVTAKGQGVRVLSPVELGMLTDIGYQVTPGTGTSTLMFVGFLFTRRLRKK